MPHKLEPKQYSLAYYCGLLIAALLSGYIAIGLSFQYQFHEGLVSWYFPHAVRVVALFMLPFRHWAVFLFFTAMGSDAYYHLHYPNDEGLSLNTIKIFLIYYASELSIGAVIYAFYKRYVSDWFTISGVAWILSLSVLYRFTYLLIPGVFKLGFFSLIPAENYVEYFVAIQLSGYLVGFYFLSIVFVSKFYFRYKNKISRGDYISYLMVVLLLLLTNIVLFYAHPVLEYLLRIAVLIPLVLIALRYGGFGVLLTSTVIVTTLMVFLFDAPAEQLLEYQPIILSYLMIGLMLSAVMFENSRTQQQTLKAKAGLKLKNTHLSNMAKKMTDLSKKVITIQENERKFLSQELHDEIGQNLTALKASIYLAELSVSKDQHFIEIKENADMMYHSVYELMNWLRPSILDRFGLIKTLEGSYFQDRLAVVDVKYVPFIKTNHVFPEHIETAVFRICQEAVNNVIKHSNATLFELHLSVEHNIIHMKLRDNGTIDSDKSIHPSGGFGLDGINDRAITLQGICVFTRQDGFVIDVKIPIKDKL